MISLDHVYSASIYSVSSLTHTFRPVSLTLFLTHVLSPCCLFYFFTRLFTSSLNYSPTLSVAYTIVSPFLLEDFLTSYHDTYLYFFKLSAHIFVYCPSSTLIFKLAYSSLQHTHDPHNTQHYLHCIISMLTDDISECSLEKEELLVCVKEKTVRSDR